MSGQQRKTALYTAQDPVRDRAAIEHAARVLRQGGLVVFATETVYGLGANALDSRAAEQIFAAKGRPGDNPLIVHITRMEQLAALAVDVPPAAHRLAARFWPGPLTMILPKSAAVPDAVSGGLATVAVRMPSYPVARALIDAAGVPVAAPSANRSGGPSPTTAQHCIADLDGRVDVILDSGSCPIGVESTVLTLATPVPRLLRPGAVTPEQLREVLEVLEVDDAVFHDLNSALSAASPGMKYRHYAPKAGICLVHGSFAAYRALLLEKQGERPVALCFDGECAPLEKMGLRCVSYGREEDPVGQAERLFSALRELDAMGARQVYARAPATAGVGLAVYNRLVRAAAFCELYV